MPARAVAPDMPAHAMAPDLSARSPESARDNTLSDYSTGLGNSITLRE
jgi:hypothetical protein